MGNSSRRTIALWLVGVALMQAAWILTIPPFRGIDEFDHAYRAAAVADGEWYADEWAENGRGIYVTAPTDIVQAARFQCEQLGYTGPDNCQGAERVGDGSVRVASGAGTYHPLFYWVVGTAAQPFDGVTALFAMRIATAALCLGFLGIAVAAAARTGSRWPVAGLTVALTPVMVYSSTVPAPNGLEMAAAMALWALLASMVTTPERPSKTQFVLAVLAAVTVCTLRMLGPLFVLLILVTVVVFAPKGAARLIRESRRQLLVSSAVVAAATAAAAVWILGTGSTHGPPGAGGVGVITLQEEIVWNLQTIAAFPLRDDEGALIVYPIFLVLAAAVVFLGVRKGMRSQRLAVAGAAVVSLTLPLALSFLTQGEHGVIWQGRYLLPYSVGVLILSGWLMGSDRVGNISWRVVGPSVVAIWIGVTACLLKVKHTEVQDGLDPAWNVPPDYLLVLLAGTATVAFALALAGIGSRRSMPGPSSVLHPNASTELGSARPEVNWRRRD